MLEQKFRQWEQEFIEKGKLAGLAEGRAEGMLAGLINQRTTLLEMLSDRFGTVPTAWKDEINYLTDPAIIGKLTRAILKVKSADDFEMLLSGEHGREG